MPHHLCATTMSSMYHINTPTTSTLQPHHPCAMSTPLQCQNYHIIHVPHHHTCHVSTIATLADLPHHQSATLAPSPYHHTYHINDIAMLVALPCHHHTMLIHLPCQQPFHVIHEPCQHPYHVSNHATSSIIHINILPC